jgi:hypothetical protein
MELAEFIVIHLNSQAIEIKQVVRAGWWVAQKKRGIIFEGI